MSNHKLGRSLQLTVQLHVIVPDPKPSAQTRFSRNDDQSLTNDSPITPFCDWRVDTDVRGGPMALGVFKKRIIFNRHKTEGL